MIIFLTIGVVCVAIFGAIVSVRVNKVRKGLVTDFDPVKVHHIVMPVVHKKLSHVGGKAKRAGHHTSFHVLVFMREIVLFFKYISTRLEKKFSRTIDLVKGKGVVTDTHTGSFFLNEIKNHRDQIRGTMGAE